MNIVETGLPGIRLLRPARFEDERGYLAESFRADWSAQGGLPRFVQDNVSLSTARGTVRGLHFQCSPHAQAKLVQVVRGAVFDVALDVRAGSATFGRHVALELSARSGDLLVIPEGFAHGFCTLEPDTILCYKLSAYYAREHDAGILWNDPDLGIDWPVTPEQATLSDRDRRLPRLRDVPSGHLRFGVWAESS